MGWSDDGIVLASRKHGESSAVVQLLTRDHGRHAWLARGGLGARGRGVYQPGIPSATGDNPNREERPPDLGKPVLQEIGEWGRRLFEHFPMILCPPVGLLRQDDCFVLHPWEQRLDRFLLPAVFHPDPDTPTSQRSR